MQNGKTQDYFLLLSESFLLFKQKSDHMHLLGVFTHFVRVLAHLQ